MSQENVEIVRRLIDAFETGDAAVAWTAALEVLDSDMEMDMTRLPAPGLARVYNGPDEIAAFWREWLDAWGSLGVFEDFEVIDAEDQVVVWAARQTMQGKGSGIEIEMPEYAWTMTVRDGKIVRATMFMGKADALEAAGLSE
jgi:ketosteroid isomerase-like protein